jgi:hypothetical protein
VEAIIGMTRLITFGFLGAEETGIIAIITKTGPAARQRHVAVRRLFERDVVFPAERNPNQSGADQADPPAASRVRHTFGEAMGSTQPPGRSTSYRPQRIGAGRNPAPVANRT